MRSMSSKGQSEGQASSSAVKQSSTSAAPPQGHVNFGGMHHRRDKRYPFRSGRVRPEDLAEAQAYEASLHPDDEDVPAVPDWSEALMLWLSWNSTYEKVTARMCKPGQDSAKLEAMMDEMDQLRKRAIELSEEVLAE